MFSKSCAVVSVSAGVINGFNSINKKALIYAYEYSILSVVSDVRNRLQCAHKNFISGSNFCLFSKLVEWGA